MRSGKRMSCPGGEAVCGAARGLTARENRTLMSGLNAAQRSQGEDAPRCRESARGSRYRTMRVSNLALPSTGRR